MKRKRLSEEQIIWVLRKHELGAKTTYLCSKHRISEASFLQLESKFGGLNVSETEAALRSAMAPRLGAFPRLCKMATEQRPHLQQ